MPFNENKRNGYGMVEGGGGGSELQFYVTFFRLGAKSMEGGG